jgi:hypothetical protein
MVTGSKNSWRTLNSAVRLMFDKFFPKKSYDFPFFHNFIF